MIHKRHEMNLFLAYKVENVYHNAMKSTNKAKTTCLQAKMFGKNEDLWSFLQKRALAWEIQKHFWLIKLIFYEGKMITNPKCLECKRFHPNPWRKS